MACRFEITLPGELSQHLDAARAALDTANALEDQLTIFRDTSELAAINRDAALGPVPVEARLHELLRLCHQMFLETDGAFDITSTPLSRTWGFLRRQGRLPDPDELEAARATVGMTKVRLETEDKAEAKTNDQDEPAGRLPMKTVRFDRHGMCLNLGGVGKGYALDRMAAELAETGIETALLSAGSSSFRALGAGPEGSGFRVGIRDPFNHRRRYGSVRLDDNALGVSGAGEQFFEVGGRRYGHIIDPRSGWPVEGRALVAVSAPTATQADALATAIFVGGAPLAERYTRRHPEVTVVVLDMPLEPPTASPGARRGSAGRPDAMVFGSSIQWRVNRAA